MHLKFVLAPSISKDHGCLCPRRSLDRTAAPGVAVQADAGTALPVANAAGEDWLASVLVLLSGRGRTSSKQQQAENFYLLMQAGYMAAIQLTWVYGITTCTLRVTSEYSFTDL